jgi:hypothetical protein
VPFSTPLSEGVHVYHTYQPWFDVDDDDNVLFASVQGYGPKSSSMPGASLLREHSRTDSQTRAGHMYDYRCIVHDGLPRSVLAHSHCCL